VSNKNLGAMHPCTQCELADAAHAFIVWFRTFVGRDVMTELNCEALDVLRAALARANAEHGRSAS